MENRIDVNIEIVMQIIKCLKCESKFHDWQESSLHIGTYTRTQFLLVVSRVVIRIFRGWVHGQVFLVTDLFLAQKIGRLGHGGFFDPRFISLHQSCELGVKLDVLKKQNSSRNSIFQVSAAVFQPELKNLQKCPKLSQMCHFGLVFGSLFNSY